MSGFDASTHDNVTVNGSWNPIREAHIDLSILSMVSESVGNTSEPTSGNGNVKGHAIYVTPLLTQFLKSFTKFNGVLRSACVIDKSVRKTSPVLAALIAVVAVASTMHHLYVGKMIRFSVAVNTVGELPDVDVSGRFTNCMVAPAPVRG